MKLVVIEGAGKVKTIEKYLGKDYKVFATRGHIRDLPKKTLAVNVRNNFEPKYEVLPEKADIVKELKKLSDRADTVYLATDPDREGEAISWHIAHVLGIKEAEPVRVVFNEISQKAVQNGLSHPRAIDENLVDAQQARRVLDRLVGYKLSPVLCKKIKNNLSAGRVQSVTLRLIVEREREIRGFKPEEYWPFFSVLKKDGIPFKAALFKENGKALKLKCRADVDRVLSALAGKDYTVASVKKSVAKSRPPAPFITSSMQQDALNKLGMNLNTSSKTAQALYEGVDIPGEGKVALITYIRTDSTRVSPDAQNAARAYIRGVYGDKYVPEKPNFYASKKSAQDAHEAIRPISVERTPEDLKRALSKQHYELYKLIYERFLASQMSEALYNSVAVEVAAGSCLFKVNGRTPLFAGFTAVYNAYVDEDNRDRDDDDKNVKLPELNEGDKPAFVEYKFEQKFTKPPARYTEAGLVKLMEEKGIGRPATYVPTVTLLGAREYTQKEGKYLSPTQLGEDITDMLVKFFPDVMDVGFTAQMEGRLDGIEEGGVEWQRVVGRYYDGLEDKIAAALGDSFSLKAPDEKSDVVCESCGRQMVVKQGKYGKFLACPGFPKCKNTKNLDENGNVVEREAAMSARPTEDSGAVCEKCGKPMVYKEGRYGRFLACSGYPQCKNIKNPQDEPGASFGNCPLCGKPIKRITTRKSVFYGCTGYPDCGFTAFNPVSAQKCAKCGGYMTEKPSGNTKELICGNKDCGHRERL
ncbi:MAG: type I DNA topoisomerase [Clostridiales bacterium]|jgi:DNA topoisomerase-1|nr:type I DNA topoisomerase [Clostridiales bacterium]